MNPQLEAGLSDKGEGAGGGGGMVAKAKGVFEVTFAGTRFKYVITQDELNALIERVKICRN
jgi:hypothetical protein